MWEEDTLQGGFPNCAAVASAWFIKEGICFYKSATSIETPRGRPCTLDFPEVVFEPIRQRRRAKVDKKQP